MIGNDAPTVVLFEPEIPQNVGNVARTCFASGVRLVLVGRLGFFLTDRHLRRAGVGYIDRMDLVCYPDFSKFLENEGQSLSKLAARRVVIASKRGKHCVWDYSLRTDDILLFGNESKGLPSNLLECYYENSVRLPMRGELRKDEQSCHGSVRCLNLATTVGIFIYEALRQTRAQATNTAEMRSAADENQKTRS